MVFVERKKNASHASIRHMLDDKENTIYTNAPSRRTVYCVCGCCIIQVTKTTERAVVARTKDFKFMSQRRKKKENEKFHISKGCGPFKHALTHTLYRIQCFFLLYAVIFNNISSNGLSLRKFTIWNFLTLIGCILHIYYEVGVLAIGRKKKIFSFDSWNKSNEKQNQYLSFSEFIDDAESVFCYCCREM